MSPSLRKPITGSKSQVKQKSSGRDNRQGKILLKIKQGRNYKIKKHQNHDLTVKKLHNNIKHMRMYHEKMEK
jgi:hypothetical protein